MLFEILPDALLDAVLDTLKLIPFLFLAYLLIEVIEHHAEDKTVALIHRAGDLRRDDDGSFSLHLGRDAAHHDLQERPCRVYSEGAGV